MLAEAKLVVIGGGVAGCSLLYHLARLGWTDSVLLEQHELTSGSTWHAAGLCTQFNQSYNLMGLLRRSVELYETLEGETGQAVDYHRCGSLRIATTEERLHQFHHVAGIASSVGVPFELVSPERAVELFPVMDPGRRPRGGVPPDRRPRRPDRADERVRARGDVARRAHPAAHARHGPPARLGRLGRRDARGGDQGRDRRQRGRAVGARGRTPGRARAAARADAAPLRRHGADSGGRGP